VSYTFLERPACPACRAKESETLFSGRFTEGSIREYLLDFYPALGEQDIELLDAAPFTLARCDECGLIRQVHAPGEDLLEALYNHWAPSRDEGDHRRPLAYYRAAAQEVMLVLDYLRLPPSEVSVLDFGMGWGGWPRMALAFGCQAYGLELAEEPREFARAHGVRVISAEELGEHRFDFINTEQVFEHLVDPLEVLMSLRASLKPSGLVKISVPSAAGIDRELRRPDWAAPKGSKHSLNAVAPLEHLNCFPRTALVRMAASAGLRPIRMPLRVQYAASTNWRPFVGALRNLVKPLYRNLQSNRPYIFLGRA